MVWETGFPGKFFGVFRSRMSGYGRGWSCAARTEWEIAGYSGNKTAKVKPFKRLDGVAHDPV